MTALAGLTHAFRDSERHLWGLCYRMTGSAADADDLVQETFARAIERPPRDTDRPWRPWLIKVAMNLSRDHLRRRRRRGYVGVYLPAAVEPPAWEHEGDEMTTAGRYDLLESVSMAFLLALEQLTPQRRAVLLLRDVFDYSVRETADALGMSEVNVKTTLHRARRQMAEYERRRPDAPGRLAERTGAVLQAMFQRLVTGDAEGFAALLAEDVRALSDGGGEYKAARKPVIGRDKVTRFVFGLLKRRRMPSCVQPVTLNGLPSLVVEWDQCRPGDAPRAVVSIAIDSAGQVSHYFSLLATRKLAAVAPLG